MSQVCGGETSKPDLRHGGLPPRSNIVMIILGAIEDKNVKDMVPALWLVLHSHWLLQANKISQWYVIRHILQYNSLWYRDYK